VIQLLRATDVSAASGHSGGEVFEATCQISQQALGLFVMGQSPRLTDRASVIASSSRGPLEVEQLKPGTFSAEEICAARVGGRFNPSEMATIRNGIAGEGGIP